MTTWLSDFVMSRPRFELEQEETLNWLVEAHTESETTTSLLGSEERDAFRNRLRRLVDRCACSSPSIARRGFALGDVSSTDFSSMEIYNLRLRPHGHTTTARSHFFSEVVTDYMLYSYEEVGVAPADIVHVTCTGFVSPSPAQRLVQARDWPTRVTHAYQMGCYAALPALRIASGFCAVGDVPRGCEARVDIVHSEVCSLHLDPSLHSPEQLVVQSLFGDGFIRYSARSSRPVRGFEILSLAEYIVPGTEHAMSWTAGDFGMLMTLDRQVPELLGPYLKRVVAELLVKAGRDLGAEWGRMVFALHPGGPRIIDQVKNLLELREDQVAASRGVLRDYGNMSSATLPHVWQRLLDDDQLPSGALILSLAFGPGLTIAGGLMQKT